MKAKITALITSVLIVGLGVFNAQPVSAAGMQMPFGMGQMGQMNPFGQQMTPFGQQFFGFQNPFGQQQMNPFGMMGQQQFGNQQQMMMNMLSMCQQGMQGMVQFSPQQANACQQLLGQMNISGIIQNQFSPFGQQFPLFGQGQFFPQFQPNLGPLNQFVPQMMGTAQQMPFLGQFF